MCIICVTSAIEGGECETNSTSDGMQRVKKCGGGKKKANYQNGRRRARRTKTSVFNAKLNKTAAKSTRNGPQFSSRNLRGGRPKNAQVHSSCRRLCPRRKTLPVLRSRRSPRRRLPSLFSPEMEAPRARKFSRRNQVRTVKGGLEVRTPREHAHYCSLHFPPSRRLFLASYLLATDFQGMSVSF